MGLFLKLFMDYIKIKVRIIIDFKILVDWWINMHGYIKTVKII